MIEINKRFPPGPLNFGGREQYYWLGHWCPSKVLMRLRLQRMWGMFAWIAFGYLPQM